MERRLPVVLEGHFFTRACVAANPKFEPSDNTLVDAPIDSRLDLMPLPDNERRFQAQLAVRLDAGEDRTLPYSVDVVCVCNVAVEDGIPEQDCKGLAGYFAHTIMYPAIRELVLTLTARQSWGPFSIGLAAIARPPQGKAAAAPSADAAQKAPKRRRIKIRNTVPEEAG